MNKKVALIAVFVCLTAILSLALAQQPAPPPENQGFIQAPPGLVGDPSKTLPPEEIARLKFEKEAAELEAAAQREAKRNDDQQILLQRWQTTENEAERGKIQAELQKILKELFEEQANKQDCEIKQLEAKVKRLRDRLDLRMKKKNEIIEMRLQLLLRNAEGLGWGTENEAQEFPAMPTTLPSTLPLLPGSGLPGSGSMQPE